MSSKQHLEFYWFMQNKAKGYNGQELFPYSSSITSASPTVREEGIVAETEEEGKLEQRGGVVVAGDGLIVPGQQVSTATDTPTPTSTTATATATPTVTARTTQDSELEGYNADPSTTKIVLRPWYERSKHIYPMSTWKEFSTDIIDYSKETRKDADGNSFFASSSSTS